MREYLELGPTPCSEDCAQLGTDGFQERVRREAAVYVRQLKRIVGSMGEPVPESFSLGIRSFSHDFGSYVEVVAYYSDEASAHLAFELEANIPEWWDEQARAELGTLRGGEPCPRCRAPLASFSPSGRGRAACDACNIVYEEE